MSDIRQNSGYFRERASQLRLLSNEYAQQNESLVAGKLAAVAAELEAQAAELEDDTRRLVLPDAVDAGAVRLPRVDHGILIDAAVLD